MIIEFDNDIIAKECNKLDVGCLIAPHPFEFYNTEDSPKVRFITFGNHACVHLIKYLQSKLNLVKSGIEVLPSPFVYRY
jgi:hypothetical protein